MQEISDEERDGILEILHPCCPDLFAPVPLPSDSDWELPIVVEYRLAFKRQYGPLTAIIRRALAQAHQRP